MVRTSIVDHPSQWPFCGYNEIQEPKRKNVLIDYEKLRASLGLESYDLVKSYHRKWVEEYLGNGKKIREDKWSGSIAAPLNLVTLFNWGREQRLCTECEIHAGWSGQGKKSQKNRGRLSAPRAINTLW